jgi:phenylalanyl-tRNA synthetase beta chain
MKISLNWLNEYLPSPRTAEELEGLLTDTGLEVEGFEVVETVKGGLEGVIVAEVVECEQHPNADRLKVTRVNIHPGGQAGSEVLQVVCGAPNVAKGQKVLLATVGCTLYPSPEEPLKIKVSKIRDVESHGMLCAEDELGLGKSHDGILVLDASAVPGTPAAEFLQLESDTQIEIGLTPNRADALGHIGVARDILAYDVCHNNSTASLKLKEVNLPLKAADLKVEIEVKDTEKCPRYMGISISGVEVKPSPAWLQNKLRAVGLSPINNVVDVTNYVMRELGTPLHAFDAAKVNGKVIVRRANEKETITTLDGEKRELTSEDLVIANASEPMCIAGVFGGIDSGISDATTSVFLEAAYFNPVSVRKTAKRFGLSTDASFRFERGVDVDLVPYAIERATQLILEVAGGSIASEIQDLYPNPIRKRKVTLRFARCASVLGHQLPNEQIKSVLKSLDFEIVKESNEELELLVPNYRVDVDREIDVIEEILRIVGFNSIPFPAKMNTSLVVTQKPDLEALTVRLSEVLVGLGFDEIMNNSLTSSSYVEKLGGDALRSSENVELLNPLSNDLSVMRQTLIFQVMESVAHNQNRQRPNVRLFEFGKTYKNVGDQYFENKRLVLAITGAKTEESWSQKQESSSYFGIKAVVRNVFERLGLATLYKESALENKGLFVDGEAIYILKNQVGSIGWVNNATKKHFGVKQDVFIADLDWDAVLDSLKLSKTQYKELPKTFEVRRDFSLLLDTKVKFSEIEGIARKVDKKILQNISLFDVYEGKNLPEGKKSYAVSFTFQDAEQTLKDAQVDVIMNSIRTELEKQLGAELR